MLACKETAILHLFALAVAAIVFRLRNHARQSVRRARCAPDRCWPRPALFWCSSRFCSPGSAETGKRSLLYCTQSRTSSRGRPVKVIKSPSGITASFSPAGGPADCWSRLPASGSSSASESAVFHPMLYWRITRSGHRRNLQPHSIQDAMAGAESLAAACTCSPRGRSSHSGAGRKRVESAHRDPSCLRSRSRSLAC